MINCCPPGWAFLTSALPHRWVSSLPHPLSSFQLVGDTNWLQLYWRRSLHTTLAYQGKFHSIEKKNLPIHSFWRIPIVRFGHQSAKHTSFLGILDFLQKISHRCVLGYFDSVSDWPNHKKTLCFLGRLMWLKKKSLRTLYALADFAVKKNQSHPFEANSSFADWTISIPRQNKKKPMIPLNLSG